MSMRDWWWISLEKRLVRMDKYKWDIMQESDINSFSIVTNI